MPILGIIASGKTASTISTNSYESISTVTVGSGGQSTITFSSIPSTYKHLQIRALAKSARTSTDGATYRIQFNSDGGSSYSYQRLIADGASSTGDANGPYTYIYTYSMAASSSSVNASLFGVGIFDILDYSTTVKNKTLRFVGGFAIPSTGQMGTSGGAWFNTNAISSIAISIDGGSNFVENSTFALYGIKD
jgi:hypothetical protein